MAVEAASVAASSHGGHHWQYQWQYQQQQQQHPYPPQSDLLLSRGSVSISSPPSPAPAPAPPPPSSSSSSSSGKLVFDPTFLKLATTIPPAFIWPEGHHHPPADSSFSAMLPLKNGIADEVVAGARGAEGKETEGEEEKQEEEEAGEEELEDDIVPTIDLSKWRSNEYQLMTEIAKQAYDASTGIGFFQVINHGVSDELIQSAHKHCRAFFNLPAGSKQRAERRVGESYGYASSFTSRFSSRLPWKETFSLQPSPESNISALFRTVYDDECAATGSSSGDCRGYQGRPVVGSQSPASDNGDKETMEEKETGDDGDGDGDCRSRSRGRRRCDGPQVQRYVRFLFCCSIITKLGGTACSGAVLERYSEAMIGLGLEVLDVLSAGLELGLGLGLGQEEEEEEEEDREGEEAASAAAARRRRRKKRRAPPLLRRYFQPEHSSILRLNKYPTCQQPWLTYGTGPHTDPTGLTLLHQDHVAGLQVFHRRRWHTVSPRAHAFVVNIGDTLMALTNARFKSCLHRALVNQHHDRHSIAFFFNPGFHVLLSPPQELLDDAHPRAYPDFTWARFLYFTQSIHRSSVNTLHAFNQWLLAHHAPGAGGGGGDPSCLATAH